MNSAASFARDYAEARAMFRVEAAASGGALECVKHPETAPDGSDLSCDVAWFGARDAENVLVTISGTHGVEGFCGSGAQVDALRRGGCARLPPNVAVLMIHAINPYGFAWLRRVTHENIDLNRNWIDFGRPAPENPGYADLHPALCPSVWSSDTQAAALAAVRDYTRREGEAAAQFAVSGGQYHFPTGIHYGGVAPSWSRRTQSEIFSAYLTGASKVAVIDYHTGLGPWGNCELIATTARTTESFRRAAAWFGATVTSTHRDAVSGALVGDGLSAVQGALPNAQVTAVALEFGTLPSEKVLQALLADAWLHTYGDPKSPAGQAIKAEIRSAFYGDTDDWKGMVAGVSLMACRQAVLGLMSAL